MKQQSRTFRAVTYASQILNISGLHDFVPANECTVKQILTTGIVRHCKILVQVFECNVNVKKQSISFEITMNIVLHTNRTDQSRIQYLTEFVSPCRLYKYASYHYNYPFVVEPSDKYC